MRVGDIISAIEQVAVPAYQESWDNTGLQCGDLSAECSGVLLCVDVTPGVIDEAVARGCNLVVSHHPLLFKGVKRLTGSTPVEQALIKAVRGGVSVYSSHTALDSVPVHGVSAEAARRIGVADARVLVPGEGGMVKLSVIVPRTHREAVKEAVFAAGAGRQGNYSHCCYESDGTGQFMAGQGARPFVGVAGMLHHEPECRIDMVVPSWRRRAVEQAMLAAHPYEEPAYEFISLLNAPATGLGAVGNLESALSAEAFVERVKTVFGSPVARCSKLPSGAIGRVALCGGSGGEFIGAAIAAGAQAYVTSDVRYHDFVDYGGRILIVDIGHYESESCTKEIFYRIITEKFPNFATYYSETEKNPINYL